MAITGLPDAEHRIVVVSASPSPADEQNQCYRVTKKSAKIGLDIKYPADHDFGPGYRQFNWLFGAYIFG